MISISFLPHQDLKVVEVNFFTEITRIYCVVAVSNDPKGAHVELNALEHHSKFRLFDLSLLR